MENCRVWVCRKTAKKKRKMALLFRMGNGIILEEMAKKEYLAAEKVF